MDYENRMGQNALIVAAQQGNVTLMETLLDYGAKVEYVPATGFTALITASKAGKVRKTHSYSSR